MAWHARLSASQTKQWMICPGSIAFIQHHELGGDSGIYAQQGTAAHALVERCLGEGSIPEDYRGRLIEIIDPGGEEGTSILKKGARWPKQATRVVFEVDDDMIEATEKMVFYIHRRCGEMNLIDPGVAMMGTEHERAKAVADLVKAGTVRLEKRVTPLPERDDTGGTSDVTIDAWPEEIETVDYKHGSGVFVPVKKNPQLRSYLLGNVGMGGHDYENLRYTICQPRHKDAPWDGVMSETIEASELYLWKDELLNSAVRVDEARVLVADGATLEDLFAQGYLSVGDEDGGHCTFCELATRCPAAIAKVREKVGKDFDDDEPEEIEVGPLGSNSLAMLLPWIPFIDKFAKKVKAEGEQFMLGGGDVAGYKVVRKPGNRSYRSDLSAEQIADGVSKDFGIDKKDLYKDPDLKPMGTVEKMIPAKERGQFEKDYLYKPTPEECGLTIAPEDDKREAVKVSAADDFDDD